MVKSLHNGGMDITKRVSVTCIISIPAPLFKRGGHYVARFLHFCCGWRKNRLSLRAFGRYAEIGGKR